jgi:anti-sigma factor RsiW
MTCRELVEFLMDYLAEELPADERRRFDEHLADCPDCVAYLTSYKETVRLGRAVCKELQDAVPAEVPEELVQAVLAARPRRDR